MYYFYIRCPEQLHDKSVHREVRRLQYGYKLLRHIVGSEGICVAEDVGGGGYRPTRNVCRLRFQSF